MAPLQTQQSMLPRLPPRQVFISHASADEAIVRWLDAQVRAAGHRVWVAEWEPAPGGRLLDKVVQALRESDAYICLLTQAGYDSVYVANEVGVAVASGKPVIALVDEAVTQQPLGMLAEIEQVRFSRDDLSACAAAVTAGLRRVGESQGVRIDPPRVLAVPTQPALFSISIQMDAQFHITANQVLVGVTAALVIRGLFYIASQHPPEI
jgi:nucleoside 2-deoxyribosyltransferase